MSNGKCVLITGGAGFLGSHVTDRAMREGFKVVVVDNLYTGRPQNIEHHVGHPRFTFVKHDVREKFPPEVTSLKFDFIFHLACAASPVHYQADPIGTTMTCVNGTLHSLQEATRCDCPVLIASTSEVYGDPIVHPQTESYWGNVNCTGIRSCYDEGKRCGEALCFDFNRQYKTKIRVVRIFNTYGPRMCFNDGRIISNFLVQALRGDDITVYGTGEYTRSFQFCEDLVEGFWRFIHQSTEIGPINLGNPEEYSVLDMAKKAQALVPGTKSKIVFLEAAKDDPKQRRPDISKAKAILGWEPKIPVDVGMRRTLAEFASRVAAEKSAITGLYVQCNPLLDISSHVQQSFLDKYNLKSGSIGLVAPEQMDIYKEMEGMQGVTFIPGGSGLNTARVAQWMSRAPKNAFVSYVGCIHDDHYGATLKNSAEKEGVKMIVEYATDEKIRTGSCAVCVVGKERTLLANLGASSCISPQHLQTDRVKNAMANCGIMYYTGFSLVAMDSVHILPHIEAATTAPRHTKIAINLSAPFVIQFFGARLEQILPYVDIVFSNDDEARMFSEVRKWDAKEVAQIASLTAKLPKKTAGDRLVVFTQGKNPTVWATPSASGSVAVKPIPVEKIIDTNGAGDSFVGGFLAALAKGKTTEQCIDAGNYAAGVIIQHDGCTFPETPSFDL